MSDLNKHRTYSKRCVNANIKMSNGKESFVSETMLKRESIHEASREFEERSTDEIED